MRRIPIRIRLTAWFVAVIAAALVVLGSFVVTRLRADLTNEVDRALTVTAAQITEAYRDEGPGEFADATRETIAAPSSRTLGAQVLDDRGRVVHAVGAELIRSRVPSLELAMSARAGTTYIASFTVTGTHLRAISVPVQVGDGRGAVIVAEPLDDVDTAVRQALGLLLVGGSVALLLAGLGGWHVARRALHPVERMAIRAEKVDIEDLDQRIPVPPADDELRHLAQTLNAMLDRIQEGVAARERLIADASHELRGPLAAMRAEIDVSLRHDEIAPVTRALLKSQREEVVRLTRIVDNLLTLARMDDGHLELLRSPHDLLELAHRSARTHAASAEAAGVELAVTGEATPVSCDRDRIEQVIGNLLDNAIRVSPRSGTVRIRVTRDGQCAFLEVTDDGPGVPPPERTRIFERFARIDPARGRVGGAGLGLAISREIVAAHGGRLELSTGDETGSTFTMTLDTVEPDVAAPASP